MKSMCVKFELFKIVAHTKQSLRSWSERCSLLSALYHDRKNAAAAVAVLASC